MTIYTYLLVYAAGDARRITGTEDKIKTLWIKGVNRLFRVVAGVVYHQAEEYDGTGWVTLPTEAL